MNAVALAADKALSTIHQHVSGKDRKKAKMNVKQGKIKSPTSMNNVLDELHHDHGVHSLNDAEKMQNVAAFNDAAEREAINAETALLATQKAAQNAINKARARVVAAKARAHRSARTPSNMSMKRSQMRNLISKLSTRIKQSEADKSAEKKVKSGTSDADKLTSKATGATAKQPKMVATENKSVETAAHKQEKLTAELGESEHIWIDGKPMTVPKKNEQVRKVAKNTVPEAVQVAQEDLSPELGESEHLWIDGKPMVIPGKKKKKKVDTPAAKTAPAAAGAQESANTPKAGSNDATPAPLAAKPRAAAADAKAPKKELGEAVESLDQMRSMWIKSTHNTDSSASVKDQNKLLGKAEYNFSVRNTDKKTGRAMGVAKNVQLKVKLPKTAKLQDAYFYLEAAHQHDTPKSMNCKLDHGDAANSPTVNCLIPHIKDIVDVNVRAQYDGDQAALESLASADVEATLHEGHEVLSTSKMLALKRAPIMKNMPHSE